jgi:hypothetical protein
VVRHMWCGIAAIAAVTAVTAIAVGEGCVRILIAATDDEGGRPVMTGGWDNDGRRDGSAVVTASIHRACEGVAIGGGGHDDAASSGWVVVLGEHDRTSLCGEGEACCHCLYTSPRLCVVMTTTSHLCRCPTPSLISEETATAPRILVRMFFPSP